LLQQQCKPQWVLYFHLASNTNIYRFTRPRYSHVLWGNCHIIHDRCS
jgi:hypothetical protein